MLRAPAQEERARHVGRQSEEGHDGHQPAVHGLRVEQPEPGVLEEEERDGEEHGGVDEGGDDLDPLQAVRVPGRFPPLGQPDRPQREDDGDSVAQVVERVGEEREAPRPEAADDLHDGDGEVEQHRGQQPAGGCALPAGSWVWLVSRWPRGCRGVAGASGGVGRAIAAANLSVHHPEIGLGHQLAAPLAYRETHDLLRLAAMRSSPRPPPRGRRSPERSTPDPPAPTAPLRGSRSGARPRCASA